MSVVTLVAFSLSAIILGTLVYSLRDEAKEEKSRLVTNDVLAEYIKTYNMWATLDVPKYVYYNAKDDYIFVSLELYSDEYAKANHRYYLGEL